MKRQERTPGDIVKVPLGAGYHAYARVLEEASFAFYDLRTTEDAPIDQIVSRPVLFYAAVMDQAVKRVVGPLSAIGLCLVSCGILRRASSKIPCA